MRKITVGSAVIAIWLAFAASSQCAETTPAGPVARGGLGRIGVGVNLGYVDARYEMNAQNVFGGVIKFRSVSGDDLQNALMGAGVDYREISDRAGVGGYYLRRMSSSEPAGWHLLAGFLYTLDDVCGTKFHDFALYGGPGIEYFLPGTKQVSLEASIGMGLHFLKCSTAGGGSETATQFGFEALNGGLILRMYIN